MAKRGSRYLLKYVWWRDTPSEYIRETGKRTFTAPTDAMANKKVPVAVADIRDRVIFSHHDELVSCTLINQSTKKVIKIRRYSHARFLAKKERRCEQLGCKGS